MRALLVRFGVRVKVLGPVLKLQGMKIFPSGSHAEWLHLPKFSLPVSSLWAAFANI